MVFLCFLKCVSTVRKSTKYTLHDLDETEAPSYNHPAVQYAAYICSARQSQIQIMSVALSPA